MLYDLFFVLLVLVPSTNNSRPRALSRHSCTEQSKPPRDTINGERKYIYLVQQSPGLATSLRATPTTPATLSQTADVEKQHLSVYGSFSVRVRRLPFNRYYPGAYWRLFLEVRVAH
ncbi:hypothetical protein B0H13DRAFT_1940127 [Mycena leptocephala]|nr:hypothetical protein B0H13DRAFT_1940127 [Mycena leptocephala]